MKRVAFSLAVVLVVVLVGCGEEENTKPSDYEKIPFKWETAPTISFDKQELGSVKISEYMPKVGSKLVYQEYVNNWQLPIRIIVRTITETKIAADNDRGWSKFLSSDDQGFNTEGLWTISRDNIIGKAQATSPLGTFNCILVKPETYTTVWWYAKGIGPVCLARSNGEKNILVKVE